MSDLLPAVTAGLLLIVLVVLVVRACSEDGDALNRVRMRQMELDRVMEERRLLDEFSEIVKLMELSGWTYHASEGVFVDMAIGYYEIAERDARIFLGGDWSVIAHRQEIITSRGGRNDMRVLH